MATQFARQTAIPCTLADISSGAWVQNDGLVPSGVRTNRGMISRASILGVIVEKTDDTSFSLDDGTAMTRVRSFDAKPVAVRASVGDIVLVIGRPREYNNERYLVLEICKRVRNPAWVQYRKRELAMLEGTPVAEQHAPEPIEPVAVAHTVQVPASTRNPFEVVISRIRELDTGNGADVETVLDNVADGEKFLRTLLDEGEVFEIKPGKIKVLE